MSFIFFRTFKNTKTVKQVLTGFLCWLVLLSNGFAQEDIQKLLKNFQIISKFENMSDAEKLTDSLIKNGQDISIIREESEINLKILSVGLYPDESEADAVVKHLEKNDIEAYATVQANGMYRVYAGAMRDEDHYWQRFENLLGLGYRRIHTEIKPSKVGVYYVVRPKNELLPIPFLPPPDTNRFSSSDWSSKFIESRFKGEFSLWGTEKNRGSGSYFKASVSARSQYKNNLDFTYGFRFEAMEQSADQSYQILEKDWRPTYMRYRQPNSVWTIGAINAVWDDRNRDSLSNRLDSKNLSRYRLDSDQTERERPVFALRWEYEQAEHKLDVIWTPVFRPAKLPRFGGIWHPVNREKMQIRGIRTDDTYEQLIAKGSFDKEEFLTGGVGLRMVTQIGSRTMATTLQYTRHQEPYYQLNPKIRSQLENGQEVEQILSSLNEPAFTPEHPYSMVLSWEEYGPTSQMELAMVTNTPYTTKSYEMKTAMAFEWKAGFIYPNADKYTQLSTYIHGRHINTKDSMLDRNTQIFVSGEAWRDTINGLWRFSTDYDIGINQFDVFLNPKVTFKQNRNIQIYLSYQLFSGSEGTYSGYHTSHSLVILGWQAKF